MNRCQCIKNNGQQCTRYVTTKPGQNQQFCWQHQNCSALVENSPITHQSIKQHSAHKIMKPLTKKLTKKHSAEKITMKPPIKKLTKQHSAEKITMKPLTKKLTKQHSAGKMTMQPLSKQHSTEKMKKQPLIEQKKIQPVTGKIPVQPMPSAKKSPKQQKMVLKLTNQPLSEQKITQHQQSIAEMMVLFARPTIEYLKLVRSLYDDLYHPDSMPWLSPNIIDNWENLSKSYNDQSVLGLRFIIGKLNKSLEYVKEKVKVIGGDGFQSISPYLDDFTNLLKDDDSLFNALRKGQKIKMEQYLSKLEIHKDKLNIAKNKLS